MRRFKIDYIGKHYYTIREGGPRTFSEECISWINAEDVHEAMYRFIKDQRVKSREIVDRVLGIWSAPIGEDGCACGEYEPVTLK